MWAAVEKSRHRITQIDERTVTVKAKRNTLSWSRNELRRECTHIYGHGTPRGLLKAAYARGLVALRGLRQLEHLALKKLYGIRSDNCPICKEHIRPPYFNHNSIGYHLGCIMQWITISHKFMDPITGKDYSDDDLRRIDTIADEYGIKSDLFCLKYDANRIADDLDAKEQEEQVLMLLYLIDRDVDALRQIPAYDAVCAVLRTHLTRVFRQLSYIDADAARDKISELIEANISSRKEIVELLVRLFDSIEQWSTESDYEWTDSDDEYYPDEDNDFFTNGITINMTGQHGQIVIPGEIRAILENLLQGAQSERVIMIDRDPSSAVP